MMLADSSAWVEFLRRTGSEVNRRFAQAFFSDQLLVSETVMIEVLVGARDPEDELRLKRMLASVTLVPVGDLSTWESAAKIYRACRARGVTIRGQLDCLTAAIAIREEVEILHLDRDFDLIAQHTPLRVASV